MSSAEVVERLIERNVFEATGTDELHPTESFRRAVDCHRRTLTGHDPDGRREAAAALTDDSTTVTALSTSGTYDPDFLARYVALRERDGDLPPAEALVVAVVIGQYQTGQPRTDGAPRAFLSVDGSDLRRLVTLYDRCIVYAWREDCPPCETIRADFDELFADGLPSDLLLLAVYGPGCPQLLDREFDVVGAPTVLFTLQGRVDSRLVGAPTTEGLRAEVNALRERTLSSAE